MIQAIKAFCDFCLLRHSFLLASPPLSLFVEFVTFFSKMSALSRIFFVGLFCLSRIKKKVGTKLSPIAETPPNVTYVAGLQKYVSAEDAQN